ncbi:endonuclease III [Roseomonas gilardii]|uniref:endonuclease III domain-containing protein n=1 Tax=Roseomonas gilardii TaxID=257708 RepID=UPI0011A8080C|nr:Fe-S cluster assembly protein HesB [Roseomonas gilardii]
MGQMPQDHRIPADDRSALLRQVHARLCKAYHCPIAYFHALDPLDELVSSLLSHRTKNADSARAFRQLRERFPDWESVRDAPVAEVEAAIAPCTWPEAKAPALQRTLRALTERQGRLDLGHLAGMEVAAARDWLESLPGIGPKTSAAVLSFSSLRRRALPVDSHHHRVAIRLGLIPPKLAVGPAHRVLEAMLPPEWDAQQVYDDHEVLMLHGQRCCFFRQPACHRCVLLDLCPTGQERRGGATSRAEEGEGFHDLPG